MAGNASTAAVQTMGLAVARDIRLGGGDLHFHAVVQRIFGQAARRRPTESGRAHRRYVLMDAMRGSRQCGSGDDENSRQQGQK